MNWTKEKLVKETGFEIRQVRYFIKLGLINKPGFRGPATTYSDRTVSRLKVIKKLQDEGFTLEFIKRQLTRWTDVELQRLADGATISVLIEPTEKRSAKGRHKQ